MSFDKYEESGYEHYLNLLIFSRLLCVLYPSRSRCKEINVSSRSAYPKTSKTIFETFKSIDAFKVKVDIPKSVTHLNHTPIFEWYVIKCASKNGYP